MKSGWAFFCEKGWKRFLHVSPCFLPEQFFAEIRANFHEKWLFQQQFVNRAKLWQVYYQLKIWKRMRKSISSSLNFHTIITLKNQHCPAESPISFVPTKNQRHIRIMNGVRFDFEIFLNPGHLFAFNSKNDVEWWSNALDSSIRWRSGGS